MHERECEMFQQNFWIILDYSGESGLKIGQNYRFKYFKMKDIPWR